MSLDETLEKVFKAVDADGSGQVDKKELKQMVEAIASDMSLTPDEVNEIQKGLMAAGDADGDGQLSLDEFKALMKALMEHE